MKRKMFYQASLFVPLLILGIMSLPNWISDGPTIESPYISVVANWCLFIWGLPYAMMAGVFIVWLRNKSIQYIQRVMWLLPVCFLPLLVAGGWVVTNRMDFKEFVGTGIPVYMVLSYGYVVLMRVLAGMIIPVTEPDAHA